MRKNLLVTIIIQLLGTSSPIPPTGAPPLDPARGGPLWFCPHPKSPSAAFEYSCYGKRIC